MHGERLSPVGLRHYEDIAGNRRKPFGLVEYSAFVKSLSIRSDRRIRRELRSGIFWRDAKPIGEHAVR